MIAELKPCPLCGTSARVFRIDDMDDRNFGGIGICCETDGCVQIGLRFACGEDPTPELIEQWNRRALAAPSQPAEPVAQAAQQPRKLPSSMRRHIEQAIHDAENPKGMQLNDGKERITLPGGTLRYMLALIDASHPAAEQAAQQPTCEECGGSVCSVHGMPGFVSCNNCDHLQPDESDEIDHGKSMLRVQEALGFTTTGWVSPDVVLMRIWQLQNKPAAQPSHPAAEQAARNAALEQAATVIELYDDATMKADDYMLSSTDCAGIILALKGMPAAEQAAADLKEFEKWLRTVCICAPPPQAYDLAKSAWQEAARRPVRELTDDEIERIWQETDIGSGAYLRFARALLSKATGEKA